jgi:IclR family KDG regulon transcriptional repressor
LKNNDIICDNINLYLILSHIQTINSFFCQSDLVENKPQKNRRVIASVQRALDILELFDSSRSELGNSEIARLLDLDPGTASGLVTTLRVNKYLDQNPVNRKYRLGLKLVERASVLLGQIDLLKIAAPHLENMRKWCDESINLAILNQQEIVYLERVLATHSLGIRSERGKRAPVHSTALGKAIIAYLPEYEAQEFLSQYKFFPVTRYTITDPQQFLKELDRVKKLGFAIDEEENEIGGRCLAAPVFNHTGYPVAAVSISVPIQRLPREKIQHFGNLVKSAADDISQDLGYKQRINENPFDSTSSVKEVRKTNAQNS